MSTQLFVVDAAVVAEVLRRSERCDAVAARMRGATLAAPGHLDVEVLSALRDGLDVACAETLGATPLTLDGPVARSAPVPVEVL